ncbi:MAG: winged helix-turn-helix domain-containing protein [Acidobacteria bacterium]|nr:winged helix-turn-helix domain-containing protein [Acidobacteriota bacterium]
MIPSMRFDSAVTSEMKITAPADSFAHIRLTRKESELLSVLRQNPGTCLSRQFLLRTVWGYSEGVRSRTVDVHIRRLRSKLGPEGKNHIRTVMHAGYHWDP